MVAADGNIYVADAHNYRVQKFDSEGKFLATWGTSGTWQGQFQDPTDLVVDRNGNLHVADSGNFRVQWLDAEGNYVAATVNFPG